MNEQMYEQECWFIDYQRGEEQMVYMALTAKAQICPTCNKNCGLPDFEPSDPSVGIFWSGWSNECWVHGVFTTNDDGTQEFEDDNQPTVNVGIITDKGVGTAKLTGNTIHDIKYDTCLFRTENSAENCTPGHDCAECPHYEKEV